MKARGERLRQEGGVLVLVLLALAVMGFLAIDTMKQLALDYAGSAYLRTQVQGQGLLQSGAAVAEAVLLKDEELEADHRFEDWAKFQEQLQQADSHLETGSLQGTLTDENARFPLFGLKKSDGNYTEIFKRLVKITADNLGVNVNAETLTTSVQCWLGSLSGEKCEASENYYASRTPSYHPPKEGRMFRAPNEFLLLYAGEDAEEQLVKLYEGTKDKPGLKDLTTIWGRGPINMNTALPEVVGALVPENFERERGNFVHDITVQRQREDNKFEMKWYETIGEWYGFELNTNCLGKSSNTYRLALSAQVGVASRGLVQVLRRDTSNNKTCATIYRKTF